MERIHIDVISRRQKSKPKVLKSWSLEIDYSRAPCLGADQKARGLWERDCTYIVGDEIENRCYVKTWKL